MEARRSFVSSRFFANDQRPVPNIVAIYERPRHKIRRDATHVLGGMFGWNAPEETERALRAESSRTEEATATPESATPVDPAPAGPSQRCTTKPAKRAKRRGFAPLIDMGASILSLHFQELLRRQHQPEEEDLTPVSAPAKRPIESTADISIPSTVTASASKKARISVSAGDAPIAKKLRLTISIAPPNDVPLSMTLPSSLPQLPLSPPDTSSNASKAPAEESAPGLVSAWTPMDPLLPDFDATLPLDPLDSSSSSSSSSESSSDLDSDSPDLSSSSSTRSDVQTKGKGKANTTQKAALVRKNSKSASPFPTPVPARGPSTPPRKKRPTHKPGWIGWVQTEESPDHSRLIRLDDAPVILGRRTRSGREFHDPPPPPPSRRKPANGGQPKPDQTPRPRPKPTRRGKKSEAPTGEKSQQQNALQEARKLVASGESEEVGGAAPETQEGEAGGDEPKKQATENLANGKRASEPADGEPPVVSPSERPSGPASTSVPVPPASVLEPSQEANTSSPQKRSQIGSTSFTPPTSDTSPVAPFAPVLKLTRSDAVITPTAGRPDDPSEKEHNKKDTPTNQKKSGAPIKAVSTKSLANATDDREPPSQASPSLAKATSDVSAPSKKTLAAAKNDQPKNMYIALKKSRSSTSASTSKPLVISKVGSSQRRSGWGSDTSAGETSPVVLHVPRIASPSPPEKAKRPAPVASTGNPAQSTSSSTRVPTVTSTKSGDTPASASSVKPTVATTDRQLYFSKFGKSIHVGNGASTLGKRKEPVAQASSAHFKKRKLSRKLVVSSSDESDGARPTPPTFFPNPFERRAKQMELTRKGVSGDAFRHEMDKWMDMKRAEWKAREKPKANGRDSEKSGSDGKATGNAPRPSKTAELGSGAVTDNAASKFPKDTQKGPKEPIPITRDLPRIHMVNDLPRIPRKNSTHSDHAGNSPKIQKASSKRVWNGDWGMDVHQVSVTVSGDVKNKFKKFQYRRESDGATTDRRDGDQGERRVKDHSSTQDPTNTGVAPWGARA